MEKSTISKQQLIQSLISIGHGDLSVYAKTGLRAAMEEPEIFAHLIAWNAKKGEIRDSKIAFPVLALRGEWDLELHENAIAHIISLDPISFTKALKFSQGLAKGELEIFQKTSVKGKIVKKKAKVNVSVSHPAKASRALLYSAGERYLRAMEENRRWWNKTAVQHRKALKELYAKFHVRPAPFAQKILFENEYPNGSVFEAIKNLRNMNPTEAAGTILNHKIPFLIAVGAVGGIKDKPDIILALLERMSGNEVLTNTAAFERMGVMDNPILKSGYDAALRKVAADKKVSTLKTGKAAEKVSVKVAQKMQRVQEEKLEQLGGIEGDWLVLGDRSGSMERSVELAKNIAALIAQQVKGKIYLVFFNNEPLAYDVTGKTLEEIKNETRRINASGGTNIGCGLDLIAEKGIIVNGIAVCSDGGENDFPFFSDVYRKYSAKFGVEPTVYHYWVPGETDVFSERCIKANIPFEKRDVSRMDYYALPNLVKTMRTSRFTLLDEIMATKLLTIEEILRKRE